MIELLVVIAIIGILAGLLLPALGKARQSALRAQCIDHERQLYFAARMFADDHEGWLPARGLGGDVGGYVLNRVEGWGVDPMIGSG